MIDIEPPRDRSQAVLRIQIAIARGVMLAQPKPVAVVPDLQVTSVVLVGTLGVDEFAEESFAHHVEDAISSRM